ncbi:MAG TPA: DUF6438 domain-containing protein [Kofleriaceae bacterium]|nr:DUF6438 domain-containing protein [Kofleriaceae bacterium]
MRHVLLVLAVLAACDAGRKPQPPPAATPPPAAKPALADAGAVGLPVVDASSAGPPPHELVATLKRTMCYGWCPAYNVSIYRDGVVEYDGTEYVKTKGHATGKLSQDKVDAIDKLFATAHYLDLADSYTHYDVTDNPSAITSWHHDGKTKTIEHYYGDEHAPAALTQLEEDLDKLVGIEHWIGTNEEREKLAGRGR